MYVEKKCLVMYDELLVKRDHGRVSLFGAEDLTQENPSIEALE